MNSDRTTRAAARRDNRATFNNYCPGSDGDADPPLACHRAMFLEFFARRCFEKLPPKESSSLESRSAMGSRVYLESTPDRLVFNRTVGLRGTFAKEVGGQSEP